jgi:hypothetical protein
MWHNVAKLILPLLPRLLYVFYSLSLHLSISMTAAGMNPGVTRCRGCNHWHN